MKKTEKFFMVYNVDESFMYGSFPDRESAEIWKAKIEPVVECNLKVKESSLEIELPEGISFNTDVDGFRLNTKLSPMENMASFIEWSYAELKQNINKNYEGLVALEIIKSMVQMSRVLKKSETESIKDMDEKLKKSHNQFLEAGKIYGIEFMLMNTYDYWRNQDEKDTLVNHYYSKMKK